jgi:hypothetical protein
MGGTSSLPFYVHGVTINSSGNIGMNGGVIGDVNTLMFDSSTSNRIYDVEHPTHSDLYVQGSHGLYFTLNQNGGGVIIGSSATNVSTLRPYTSGYSGLGSSDFHWGEGWVDDMYINGHRIFVQSNTPSSPSVGDVWIDIG